MDSIVPKEDSDISKELQRQFTKQGIVCNTSSNITNVKKGKNTITLEFDASNFNQESFNIITSLSEILANDELEIGQFELGIFTITINNRF